MRLLPIVTYLLSGGGRSRPTLLSAEDLHLLKTNLKEQLLKDERVWPGTMSRESLELARMLERLRPVDECSSLVDDWRREYGEFDVLSCDPLVVALEYNEASVVRGGFLARASDDSGSSCGSRSNGAVTRFCLSNSTGRSQLLTEVALRCRSSREPSDRPRAARFRT